MNKVKSSFVLINLRKKLDEMQLVYMKIENRILHLCLHCYIDTRILKYKSL